MQHVGSRDEDDIDVVGVDNVVPIRDRTLIPERSHRVVATSLDSVTDNDQFGLVVALEEVARCAATPATVGLAHPAETDDTDSYLLAHVVRPSFVVIGHRGSVAISAQVSRTQ